MCRKERLTLTPPLTPDPFALNWYLKSVLPAQQISMVSWASGGSVFVNVSVTGAFTPCVIGLGMVEVIDNVPVTREGQPTPGMPSVPFAALSALAVPSVPFVNPKPPGPAD